jgi:hypothetical protein
MKTRVEIFKTDIRQVNEAAEVVELLSQELPHCRINFDLEDCDRILRIESGGWPINIQQIIQLIMGQGYACTHLT